MIVSTLIAATVAAAQPGPAPQPTAAPAPAEKKMACCDKMAKGEGCSCCKDMADKDQAGHGTKAASETDSQHKH